MERLLIIPFPHYFSQEERDSSIIEKLEAEADKIFSLMIDECGEYSKRGMPNIPDFWNVDKKEMLTGIVYYSFVMETYSKTDRTDKEVRIPLQNVFEDYKIWCKSQLPPITPRMIKIVVDNINLPNITDLVKDEKMAIIRALRIVLDIHREHSGSQYYIRAIRK